MLRDRRGRREGPGELGEDDDGLRRQRERGRSRGRPRGRPDLNGSGTSERSELRSIVRLRIWLRRRWGFKRGEGWSRRGKKSTHEETETRAPRESW